MTCPLLTTISLRDGCKGCLAEVGQGLDFKMFLSAMHHAHQHTLFILLDIGIRVDVSVAGVFVGSTARAWCGTEEKREEREREREQSRGENWVGNGILNETQRQG